MIASLAKKTGLVTKFWIVGSVMAVMMSMFAMTSISHLKGVEDRVSQTFDLSDPMLMSAIEQHGLLIALANQVEDYQVSRGTREQREGQVMSQRLQELSDEQKSRLEFAEDSDMRSLVENYQIQIMSTIDLAQRVFSGDMIASAGLEEQLRKNEQVYNALRISLVEEKEATKDIVIKEVDNLVRETYASLAITLFAALVAGGWLGRFVMRSVNAVIMAAERLGAGDFDNREVLISDYDLGRMALAMEQLRKRLRQMVDELDGTLGGLASGCLEQRVRGEYPGAFAALQSSTNDTIARLQRTISGIRSSAEEVGNGAEEIAAGNLDLSQRTEQQASSLEVTASSMAELSMIVRENATLAHEADNLAGAARERAEHGSSVLRQTIEAMQAIKGASQKIGEIINVIDDIAFQTNLLALNASVEAARAGEQGRGFGVVANEVRNLAQRSAEAAKQIEKLIRDSNRKVGDGVKLVDRSGELLHEIEQATNQVSGYVSRISSSTNEQSAGFDEVSRSIGTMDRMTQQNAALVEQAAAASEAMRDQSQRLTHLIEFFGRQDHQYMSMQAPQQEAPLDLPVINKVAQSTEADDFIVSDAGQANNKKDKNSVASHPADDDESWTVFE